MDKKKFNRHLLLLSLVSFCFFSCGDDNDPNNGNGKEDPASIAQLSDVTLSQTLNEKQVHQLTAIGEEVILTTGLGFNEKKINWSNPTLELTTSNLFPIGKENVTVTGSKDASLPSVEITTDGHKLKVTFAKANGSYNYMNAQTFTVTVKTKLKAGVTEEELSELGYSGLQIQSLFYGDTADKHLKSNTVSLTSAINPDVLYDVKGDPDNAQYPYKLNVVYFIPSDIQANLGYRKRISTILLKHQLFTRKWMKHWGYEEKSFGLPLDANGIVDIVAVKGKEPLSAYPYSTTSSDKMWAEINSWYTDHKLSRHSLHTLVITATAGGSVSVPFFGLGRNCYAYEYAEMAYENMQIDPITGETIKGTAGITNSSIGGMLHELGHALNQPHVGPGYSQKNDPAFGMTLMGAGNQTWGKKPTFFHHASAAVMNNCQVASKTEKTFYESTSASVKLTGGGVSINGNRCTVKGSFEASVKVTDVIVRFYKADEGFLSGGGGYNSVAFVVKPKADNTFELTDAPIEELKVNSYTDYRLGVTILMENGTIAKTTLPYIYRHVNNTLECDDLINDGSWVVTTSHALPEDASFTNAAPNLTDGDLTTYLSMVKPGKSYGGVGVAAGDEVWAMIDFGKETEFTKIVLTNRNFQPVLNTKAVSFYGSNDGTTFTPIKEDVELPESKENTIALDATVKCRYLKMFCTKWDTSGGSTMQFAELGLKK